MSNTATLIGGPLVNANQEEALKKRSIQYNLGHLRAEKDLAERKRQKTSGYS